MSAIPYLPGRRAWELEYEGPEGEGAEPPGVRWEPSPYHSSRQGHPIRALIYHFTAGPRLDGTVRYFKRNDRKVSSHYVIGKDGTIVQMVPLSRSAHHAGKGRLEGCGGSVNRCSIGIEIVNWGQLQRRNGVFYNHLNRRYVGPTPVQGPDPLGRMRWWQPFTEAQYQALVRLSRYLVSRYPTIQTITGHEDVAIPLGRKNDPGGGFDWPRIRSALRGTFGGHIGPIGRPATSPGAAAPPSVSGSAGPPASRSAGTGAIDVERAIARNRFFGRSLGWERHYDDIVRVLGFTDMTPGERLFAESIARWQRGQGLTVDGIVGPNTWRRLRAVMGQAAGPSPRPAPTDTPAGGPSGTYGELRVAGRPFHYRFTPEDVLWTARFIVGEAGGRNDPDNQAVIAAMLNRYALFTHRVYPSFQRFIRAYSTTLQPVLRNPRAAARHAHRPEFVRTGGFYSGTRIPKGQLQRHLRIQRTPWSGLPASARVLAEQALAGRMPDPGIGNASEFASTRILYRQKYGSEPTPGQWREFTSQFKRSKGWRWIGSVSRLDQYRKNAFFLDARAADLPVGAVRVWPPGA